MSFANLRQPIDDLAAMLAAAIIDRRDEINASRIAGGEAGRIELQVNLTQRRIDVQILVREKSNCG